MKKPSTIATAIFAVAIVAAATMATACGERPVTTTAGGAVFDISPEILSTRSDTLVDVGTIRSGEVVQYDAWLHNAGSEPLVIKSVETSCGCTSVEYEKQPVAPGENGRFSFRFDSRGMQGTQFKLIDIYTSADRRPYKVMMQAEIENNEFSN